MIFPSHFQSVGSRKGQQVKIFRFPQTAVSRWRQRPYGKARLTLLILSITAAPLVSMCRVDTSPEQPVSVETIALYQGQDREDRILSGAKAEKEVTLYTSLPLDDATPVAKAFEDKYRGVKVNIWRAQSKSISQRIITEAQAGRFDFDVVETNGLDLEALHLERLLQQVESPHQEALLPGAMPAHREWVGTRLNVFVQAYNTDQVSEKDLPETYQDLLDSRWRGRLGIESGDPEWFATIVGELGEQKGVELFRQIVAGNGLSVRTGHTLLINLVASGEIPLILTAYQAITEKSKEKGAPIEWFVIPPLVVRPNGVAVSRRASHPHAALLLYDFMLTEAQEILQQQHRIPARKEMNAALNETPFKFVDIPGFLDQSQKWVELYEEIIISQ